MDDPRNNSDPISSEKPAESRVGREPTTPVDLATPIAPHPGIAMDAPIDLTGEGAAAARRRSFRRHLALLLSLALAAFALTTWIMVRVDVPFGILFTGPQEVVRAQLRAIGHDEFRPAYDMFSARYREQVSFDAWHELCVSHWRMFHGSVVRAETPEASGPGVKLEIYLRGADSKDYRARFTLIRAAGRWWIDDVHWSEASAERDVSRI
jgi:hypothetical protein